MSQAHEQAGLSSGSISASPRPLKYVGMIGGLLLGLYLLASILVEIALVIEFWPISLETTAPETAAPETAAPETTPIKGGRPWKKEYCLLFLSGECRLPAGNGKITDNGQLIVLALLAGGIGGMVHTLRSFVAFTGNRLLTRSWIWWYIFRPFEGAVLALVFYFVIGAGLTGGISSDSGVFGVIGFSTLVGMFSEQAVTKLKDIAETIFTKRKNKESADKLPERVTQPGKTGPKIESLNPAAVTIGNERPAIKISGTGFTLHSIARVDGKDRSTDYISETELRFTLDPSDVADVGERKIVVRDSATDAASAAFHLKVN